MILLIIKLLRTIFLLKTSSEYLYESLKSILKTPVKMIFFYYLMVFQDASYIIFQIRISGGSFRKGYFKATHMTHMRITQQRIIQQHGHITLS